jgi:hypothetical protein
MPVRSRSRASSSTRNAPQLSLSARSSSSSASKPLAMTPPSRQRRRFGQDGALSRSRAASGVASCASSSTSSGAADRLQRRAQFGQSLQAVAQARQVARAGAVERDAAGDTFDVGEAAQRLAHAPAGCGHHRRAAFDRGVAGGREWSGSRRGGAARAAGARAHRGDAESSRLHSVGAGWPRRVSVSSRLRRVAVSRPRKVASRSTISARRCGRARVCVACA